MILTSKQEILVDTLRILKLEPTVNRLTFLFAWNAAEGGKALNNPINTTLKIKADPKATDFNKAKVKNYTTSQAGAMATAATLSLKYYKPILDNLRADNNPSDWVNKPDVRQALKTWGTTNNVIAAKISDSKFRAMIEAGFTKLKNNSGLVVIGLILLTFTVLFLTFNNKTA